MSFALNFFCISNYVRFDLLKLGSSNIGLIIRGFSYLTTCRRRTTFPILVQDCNYNFFSKHRRHRHNRRRLIAHT